MKRDDDTKVRAESEKTQKTSYDLENARAQMRKGFLEFPVLLIIGSGEAYASDILSELKKADLLVVEGTMYPLLSRLKRFGLVTYEWKESRSGPPRKYYDLTPEGKKVVTQLQDSWKTLHSSIATLTKKYEKSN